MTLTSFPYNSLYQKITTFALLFSVLFACTKEPEEPEEPVIPFTRLLENESVESEILNRTINYAVLLPENYNKTADTYPVVYLLHGYGDDQTAWYKNGLIQYYSDLNVAQNGPMIFVMPQAFNTYYVNKYNGNYPYMDFFTTELVPKIDSIYRTKKDKTQRAVMGYSMGGYGALIIPAMNPEMFTISVPLSMSFRTDEQYLAEPQSVFDYQWGPIFGGTGTSGAARLTNHFTTHSPFHFFDQSDLSSYSQLRVLIDCGDDEESLSITNGELHNLMRTKNLNHEYRVRNGGHSWDYWHKSLPEALTFISYGFAGANYPENPVPIDVGNTISPNQYTLEELAGSEMQLGIFKPTSYDTDTNLYPVIFFVHDYEGESRSENVQKILSLLNNNMLSGKVANSLVVEIPEESTGITAEIMTKIINQIESNYRIVPNKKGRVLLGNEKGGATACSLIPDFQNSFNAVFLFNAALNTHADAVTGQYYYVDVTDKSPDYSENFYLYTKLRENGIDHEYRVHQGVASLETTLIGLNGALSYLSKKLKNQ